MGFTRLDIGAWVTPHPRNFLSSGLTSTSTRCTHFFFGSSSSMQCSHPFSSPCSLFSSVINIEKKLTVKWFRGEFLSSYWWLRNSTVRCRMVQRISLWIVSWHSWFRSLSFKRISRSWSNRTLVLAWSLKTVAYQWVSIRRWIKWYVMNPHIKALIIQGIS